MHSRQVIGVVDCGPRWRCQLTRPPARQQGGAQLLILFILLLFGAEPVPAADIAVPSVAVSPGGSAAVPVRFAAGGAHVVAVQFDLDTDPALSIAAIGGPAALGAGKSLTVADVSPTRKRFLLAGLNQTPLTDGDLVILTISVRSSAVGALPLHVSNLGAADKDGKPLGNEDREPLRVRRLIRPRPGTNILHRGGERNI